MRRQLVLLLLITSAFCEAAFEDHFKPCLNKSSCETIAGIDFMYLINLDRRPDRLSRCLEQLRPYGIVPYRFSAVDGKTLSFQALEDVGVRFQRGMAGEHWAVRFPQEMNGSSVSDFLTEACYGNTYFESGMNKGAISCTLSHLSILQDALKSKYETIWILEDDFLIKRDPHTISKYIKTLDSLVGHDNWDILYTDDCPIAPPKDKDHPGQKDYWYLWRPDVRCDDYFSYAQRKYVDKEIVKTGARIRTHSMIIRKSGIKKILSFEKKHHHFLAYDLELALIPKLKQYDILNPIVTFLPDSVSDIR